MSQNKISLSVATPVLNEKFFIPLWLEHVQHFADEIVIIDGGSTDGTIEIIKQFAKKDSRIKFDVIPQQGRAYSDDWNEGERRNLLLNKCSCDWVLLLDSDEFMSDSFLTEKNSLLNDNNVNVWGFVFIPFWKDPWTLRVNVENDRHWYGEKIYRLARREGVMYSNDKHHCRIQYNYKDLWQVDKVKVADNVQLMHYHYALNGGIKHNDNRRGDLGILKEGDKPNWTFQPTEYEIKTIPFTGTHPKVIRKYLEV